MKHYDVVVLGAGVVRARGGCAACAPVVARLGARTGAEARALLVRRASARAARVHASCRVRRRRSRASSSSSRSRRRSAGACTTLDPMLQVLMPGRRIEMPPATELFAREIDREFPGSAARRRRALRRARADQRRRRRGLRARRDVAAGRLLGAARDAARDGAASALWAHLDGEARPLLAEFPREHPYRTVVDVTARFSSRSSRASSRRSRSRGFTARGRAACRASTAARTSSSDFFVERVRAHGGEVELGERADKVLVRSGRVIAASHRRRRDRRRRAVRGHRRHGDVAPRARAAVRGAAARARVAAGR